MPLLTYMIMENFQVSFVHSYNIMSVDPPRIRLNNSGPIHSAFKVHNVPHLQKQLGNGLSNDVVK